MAILINNMQKPKSCSDCKFEGDYFGMSECTIKRGCSYDNCPLIEINKGPDTYDNEEEGKNINELYKQVAFLARLLAEVIEDGTITSNDMQALENIIDELPEVTTNDFRW